MEKGQKGASPYGLDFLGDTSRKSVSFFLIFFFSEVLLLSHEEGSGRCWLLRISLGMHQMTWSH